MAIDFNKAMRPNLYQLMQSGEVIANALQGNIPNTTTENFSLEYQEGDVTNRIELAEGGKLCRLDGTKTEMVNVNGQGIEISSTDTAEEPGALPIQIAGDGLVSVTGSPLVLDGLGEPTSETQAVNLGYLKNNFLMVQYLNQPVDFTLPPITDYTTKYEFRLDLPSEYTSAGYGLVELHTLMLLDDNGKAIEYVVTTRVSTNRRVRWIMKCLRDTATHVSKINYFALLGRYIVIPPVSG